ncbi:hypothetical protein ACIRP3_24655 [Streptomyces sp. NPDC101209]
MPGTGGVALFAGRPRHRAVSATASKGGVTLSTTVHGEHHCDLWDRLAAG